jgi:aryl sulfotransferase
MQAAQTATAAGRARVAQRARTSKPARTARPGGGPSLPLGLPLPLDAGEAEPTIPAHLRRAVTTRHLHCAFPGCQVPAEAASPAALGRRLAVRRARIYYARQVADTPRRYTSHDEDSTRWLGFPFRDGDIVISTRSKTGTTWVQMICALLIFGEPRLPAHIAQLSPWLDHLIAPREQVFAQLAAQQHRRFIKTHTPLDGIPLDPRVTYLVTARHPLDVAVSLYHHSGNIDRARLRQLTGQPEPATPPPPLPPLHDWLRRWIADDPDPAEQLDSLPGLMWHLADAWARRAQPNVLLVHYDNLSADLAGQMGWLVGRLGIAVPPNTWPALVRAASFESMSGNADTLVPTAGLFKSNAAFFRRGTSGAGREILSDRELAAYHDRAARLAPADMLSWLHSPARNQPADRSAGHPGRQP